MSADARELDAWLAVAAGPVIGDLVWIKHTRALGLVISLPRRSNGHGMWCDVGASMGRDSTMSMFHTSEVIIIRVEAEDGG
jgi:hypothetical protein